MRRTLLGLAGLATVLVATASASAQQPIKIGLITPYSGQFADTVNPAGKSLDKSTVSYINSRCGLSFIFNSALSAFVAGSQPSSETSRFAVGRFLHRQLHTPRGGHRSGCHSQQLCLAVREVRRYSGVLSEPLGQESGACPATAGRRL